MHRIRRDSPAKKPTSTVTLCVLVLANLLVPRIAVTQETASGEFESLSALLEEALENNPEIRAAAARVQAAAERPPQARSLADPMAGLVYRNVGFPRLSIGDEMMSAVGLRITQALPYPGKRDLRASVAVTGIDISAARLALIRRRVIREVAEAYFQLDYLYDAIAVVEETRDYVEELERVAEARYAVGEGIQQDVLKAQVEVSVLLNRLVVLEQQRDSVEEQIKRLLNRPFAEDVGPPESLEAPAWQVDLAAVQARAAESSALLRERARQIERREATVDLAVKERLPDFTLSSAYMNRGGLPDLWEVNVGMTLPIYRDTKQDRAVAEARSELEAARLDHADSLAMITAAVRDQFLRADRAARLTALYGEAIIPQALLSLESATAGYEVGRVDFLTVINNVVTLLTYQIELHRQQADFLQALARLEEHVGESLGATPGAIFRRLEDPGNGDAGTLLRAEPPTDAEPHQPGATTESEPRLGTSGGKKR